ncbi:hypothetical protein HD554DRAFT_2058344 [Boletus coccyginus]|nr:hypothetical protein HD554DRAFT_2058344 [Boletus coccyginus]
MLRSFLAPLRNLQDHGHETTPNDAQSCKLAATTEGSPLASQVKSLVEELKSAEDTHSRITILYSIQSIIGDHSWALDAFREADGFLVLMHVLSTLPATPSALSSPQSIQQVFDCMQLSFTLTSKALDRHPVNLVFFEEYVGYATLSDACDALIKHPVTFEKTLGCLLSLSVHEFAAVDLFVTLQASCRDLGELDIHFLEFATSLGTIYLPGVFKIVWEAVLGYLATNARLRLILFKILEHLTQSSHRNLAILSMLGILTPMFSSFISSTSVDQLGPHAAERRLQCKIIKRLFEMGASTQDAQRLFQCAVKEDKSLDTEMIDLIRSGLRSKWPPHISFQDTSVVTMPLGGWTTLPTSGLTFMLWVWFERMPSVAHKVFSISFGSRYAIELSMGSNGALALRTSSHREFAILSKTRIQTSRWTHIALVYHPHRASQPAVRVFVDGVLSETFDWAYPSIHEHCVGEFSLGDNRPDRATSWCIVSAYLLSIPLDDELPRFIHHLGPKYVGNFQDRALVRFLTYEASTSLNMHMAGLGSTSGETSLKKAIRDGILINEASILCKLVAGDVANFPPLDTQPRSRRQDSSSIAISGPLIAVPCRPLDLALWSIGGARLVLCLVSLVETSHELSRTIAILCESLRNCWQISEDMERVAGYDVLASILHQKSRLINMTTFEILFEFLGLSFRSPDVSTITNTIAYGAIALDFELWSMTTPDIQRAHLEHFAFLLRASRYRKFNAKVRLSKLNLVRRLLFAMQSPWYPLEMVSHIVNALGVVMQAHFSANDAIKPVVSYIAANVTSNPVSLSSQRASITGSNNNNNNNEKARLVLDAIISLLRIPTMYMKFAEALPVARIVLLWLGSEPSPALVCHVLAIIDISFSTSPSFGKKFELATGWLTLKKMLPPIWNDAIHEAALDLLLQPARDGGNASRVAKCPQMLAVVLLALRQGLLAHSDTSVQGPSGLVERMLDDLIDLHNSHSSFRQLFKSQSSTEILIECLSSFPGNDDSKVSTQLTHFGSLVATKSHVSPAQKQQILEITKPGFQPTSRVVTSSSSRLVSVQEEALRKSTSRLEEWRNTIVVSERERYRKTVIDMRERRRRITAISEGVLGGCSERDVWCHLGPERVWRLDETEGPHRTRNKLEPFTESPDPVHHAETNSTTNDGRDTEVSSTLQTDGSIKDDAEALSDDNGSALADEIAEDKHRRVRHELEPGDVIEAVSTICRVSGVDSYPGLLIFGHTHLYMLDGLIENDVGELIDAVDAPKGMFFVAGSTSHLRSPQRARRWSLEQIAGFSNKSFLFRDVALEIFFKDSRTLLAVFLDGAHRHDVSQRLQVIITRHLTHEHVSTLGLVLREMSIAMPKGMGRVAPTARDKAVAMAQRQWQNREISNYTYLSILNQLSGRTPSDATQYPVFPWVLKDYTSDVLDLSSPDSFRDLSKPMGALTPERCEIARNRYENLESVGEKPFHYGTHFSSSMIVCHFLIRMAPYTSMFKVLQGGDWDLPDRLFIGIERAYLSASQDVRGDVRELIPEFFTFPEFLENLSNLDFGSSTSGEKIHNVKLPPWAKEDALLFVHMHRQALESRYVSENLPAWIDLIWGYEQHDIDSLNVFHPLSYEGAIDLDQITDPLEREATIGIIHNFGQTPRKLFSSPHPPRNLQGILSLPVRSPRGVPEDALALTRDSRPLKVALDGPVACVVMDASGKVIPMPEGLLSPPSRPDEQIQWGKDGTLRVLHHGTVAQTIEAAFPTCAAFADQDTLVTGSDDSLVRIWRLSHVPPSTTPFVGSTTKARKGQEPSLTLVHLLRKHSAPIISLHVSRAWSVAISGSLDGSAILWDLNRGLYVRSIWHAGGDSSIEDAAVHLVAINESTGYIATCSANALWLHTINARPIAKLDLISISSVPRTRSPCVTSIAFHERDYSPLGILAIGHTDGTVMLYTWNAEDTPKGARAQWGFLKVRDLEAEKGSSVSITSLDFIGETLWVGDSSGKVVRWGLLD